MSEREEILKKLNADIIVKGIELRTLIKLRAELTEPKVSPPKLPIKKTENK